MTLDILQAHAYPWRNDETAALWQGVHRRDELLAAWFENLAAADDAATEIRDRMERAAFIATQGTVFAPLLRLACTRVDTHQIAERLHIEQSRRYFWEGARRD